MWITTTAGFYSAVKDYDHENALLVRTRDRESAQVLVDAVATLCGHDVTIREGEGTDYPYRVTVEREDFALWLADEARNYVDYSNFKYAAVQSRGKKWGDALLDVWVAMQKVTDSWVR